MKKKVYYKLNRYKVAKVEVESVEQEQAVKILNRETDRFAKSEDTYYEKCSSLDEMYEETGFEPADDTEIMHIRFRISLLALTEAKRRLYFIYRKTMWSD